METMVPRADPRLACRKMLLTQIRNGTKWGIPATLHLNTLLSGSREPGTSCRPRLQARKSTGGKETGISPCPSQDRVKGRCPPEVALI